jgi:hypothetical protein
LFCLRIEPRKSKTGLENFEIGDGPGRVKEEAGEDDSDCLEISTVSKSDFVFLA